MLLRCTAKPITAKTSQMSPQNHEFLMTASTAPFCRLNSEICPIKSKMPARIVLAPPRAVNTMISTLGKLRAMIRIASTLFAYSA